MRRLTAMSGEQDRNAIETLICEIRNTSVACQRLGAWRAEVVEVGGVLQGDYLAMLPAKRASCLARCGQPSEAVK